jgi:hypothetical protein
VNNRSNIQKIAAACIAACLLIFPAYAQEELPLFTHNDAIGASSVTDTAPVRGGTLRILSQRTFFDETFSRMIAGLPQVSDTTVDSLCSIAPISDTKIAVTLSPRAVNAFRKSLTSFDLVTAWTKVIKLYPSEGKAMFRNVKGIDAFTAGHEAVISGFHMTDDKTVMLNMSLPDTNADKRLSRTNLFPAILKTGTYFIGAANGITQTLLPTYDTANKPFLDTCSVTLGVKDNPFTSFALNKYDFITFFLKKDVAYARSILSDNSVLRVFAEDRYFLAMGTQAWDIRAAIARAVNKADILGNAVAAEGSILTALESDTLYDISADTPTAAPVINAPLGILYNNGDPASALIAQKLAVDLPRSGIPCVLKGCSGDQYDKKLLHNDYGIAVGWVPSDIMHNRTAQLRLASMWFNDVVDEPQRIATGVELPLFTVKTFALYRPYIGFYRNAFEGMYIKE